MASFSMSNSYFRFKKFTITQDRCAMKVTTDGCLFGAWCALSIHQLVVGKNYLPANHKVLDIGAGTGLLSLMYAQQNPKASIDAVEIDEAAATQASENVARSPWPAGIQIIHQNINDFRPRWHYDVILSNPPFYEQQLKSVDDKKNAAHHSSHLLQDELFSSANRLLTPNGYFFVLQPFYRTAEAIAMAERFLLFPVKKIWVRQTPQHEYFRIILLFRRQKISAPGEEELVIEIEKGKYSDEFTTLLKEYYLYL